MGHSKKELTRLHNFLKKKTATAHYLRTLHTFKSNMPLNDHVDLNNVDGPLQAPRVH